MNEYIKKKDAENIMLGSCDESALWKVRHLPTADAVEVVRCKNCKWYMPISENYGKCTYRTREHLLNEPSDYCSYGEREDNE